MTNINNFNNSANIIKENNISTPEKVIIKVEPEKLEQFKNLSLEEKKANYQKPSSSINSPILKSQSEILQDIEISFDKAPPKEKEKSFLEKLKRLTNEFNGFGLGNYSEMGKMVDKNTGHIIEKTPENEYLDTETGKIVNKDKLDLQRKIINDLEPSFISDKVAEGFKEIHEERKERIADISLGEKNDLKKIDNEFKGYQKDLKEDNDINNLMIKSLKGDKSENGVVGLKAQYKQIDNNTSKAYNAINTSTDYSFTNKIAKIVNQDWHQLKESGNNKTGLNKVMAVTGGTLGFAVKAIVYRPATAVWAGATKLALLTKTAVVHGLQKAKASVTTNYDIAKIRLEQAGAKLDSLKLDISKSFKKSQLSLEVFGAKSVVWGKAIGKGIAITIGKPIEVALKATVKGIIQPALNLTGGIVTGIVIATKSAVTTVADLTAKVSANHNLYTFGDSVKAVSSKFYDKYLKTGAEKQIDQLDKKMAKILVKNDDIADEITKIKKSGVQENSSEFIEKVDQAKFKRFKAVMNHQAEKITKTRDEHFGYTSPMGIKGTLKKWAHIALDKNTIGVGAAGSAISGAKMMSQMSGAMQAANMLGGVSGGATGLGGLITAGQGFKDFHNAKVKHDKAKEFITNIDSATKIDKQMVNGNAGNDDFDALKNIAGMVKDRSALKAKFAYASTGLLNAGSGAVTLAAVSGAAISTVTAGIAPLVLTGAALATTGAIYGKKVFDVTTRQATIDKLNLRMGLLDNSLNNMNLSDNDKKELNNTKKEVNNLQLRKDPDVAGKVVLDITKGAVSKVSQTFGFPEYKAVQALQEIFSGEKTERFSPAELNKIKDCLSSSESKAFELSINVMDLKLEDMVKPSGIVEVHNSIPLALWTHVKVSEDENGNVQKQFNSYSNKVRNIEKFDSLMLSKTDIFSDQAKLSQPKNEESESLPEESVKSELDLSAFNI